MSIYLAPSFFVVDELKASLVKTFIETPEHFRYYELSYNDFKIEPAMDDWLQIDRCFVRQEDGCVLGRVLVNLDRHANAVSGISMITFKPLLTPAESSEVLRLLDEFLCALLLQFRWVRFSVAVKNPARRLWNGWALQHQGRCYGIQSDGSRTTTGEYLDMALYEVPGSGQNLNT